MQTYLYFHVLNDELFPELERAPGVYSIDLGLIQQGQDNRIPIPKDTPMVLLVSYTLLATTVPTGAKLQLKISGPRSDGKIHESLYPLLEPADPRDNLQPIQPDPLIPIAPGTLYRRVFWVDLGALISEKAIFTGDTIRVEYGSTVAEIAFQQQ